MKLKFLTIAALLISTNAIAGNPQYISEIGRFNGVKSAPESYKLTCGECHFAYQAGLLPSKSWRELMLEDSLLDHFGESITLNELETSETWGYLMHGAAEKSYYKTSSKISRSIPDRFVPLRVTDTKYFKREHRELKPRHVKLNPDVSSISNCIACHTGADSGSFEEDDILIPNFGYWEAIEDDD